MLMRPVRIVFGTAGLSSLSICFVNFLGTDHGATDRMEHPNLSQLHHLLRCGVGIMCPQSDMTVT